MANIIYAASGDGFGHAVRAHAVGAGLIARGHDVRFLSSGRTITYLQSYFANRLDEVVGLVTIFGPKGVDALRTLRHNLLESWKDLLPTIRHLDRLFNRFPPDLIITDFEPFSAFAAQRSGLPFISLDNQHLLTHCDVALPPGHRLDSLIAYSTIRLYYTNARKYLIPTFIPARIRHHPARLVDCILRPQVYERKASEGRFLVAYKSGAFGGESIADALRSSHRLPIRAYGFNVERRQQHITFKRMDTNEFLDDLASCAGVVASAGHSLISECLYFGKPMLLCPLQRQFEQVVNAFHVERLGMGRVAPLLDGKLVDAFADDLAMYPNSTFQSLTPSLDSVLDAVENEIPGMSRTLYRPEMQVTRPPLRHAI